MNRKVVPCSPDTPPELLCPNLEPIQLKHQNPWFKVLSRGTYFSIEYDRPQVVVLPILEDRAIIMIRVKRPLINDAPLELPAGDSHEGETPREAARREFVEETGIPVDDPGRFIPILPISEMPGRMPVLLSVFQVDLSQREYETRVTQDPEITSVEAIPFSEAVRKLIAGEIYLCSPTAIIGRFLLNGCLHGQGRAV